VRPRSRIRSGALPARLRRPVVEDWTTAQEREDCLDAPWYVVYLALASHGVALARWLDERPELSPAEREEITARVGPLRWRRELADEAADAPER